MAVDLKPPLPPGYSLWLMPSGTAQDEMQGLIHQIAQAFDLKTFSAHATLLGLLRSQPAEDLDVKLDLVERLASEIAPFSLEMIGVGMRAMYFQSVFIPVVPSPEVVAANVRARELFGHEADPPYMPHFSVAYGDIAPVVKSSIATAIRGLYTFPKLIPIECVALVDHSGYPNEWKIVWEDLLTGT